MLQRTFTVTVLISWLLHACGGVRGRRNYVLSAEKPELLKVLSLSKASSTSEHGLERVTYRQQCYPFNISASVVHSASVLPSPLKT